MRRNLDYLLIAGLGVILATAVLVSRLPADEKPVDRQRAQELHAKSQRGEQLTPAEQTEYQRARAERSQRVPSKKDSPGEPKTSTGLIPLTELSSGASYKGETGGLYGDGQNEPPAALADMLRKATLLIRPINRYGFSDPQGKVVLMSMGMSNTTMEFSAFKQLADADPSKSPQLVIVDAAQGGQASEQWNSVEKRAWSVVDQRLAQAGVTPEQVQVLWIKQAIVQQGRHGEFPAHAQKLEQDLIQALNIAVDRYPNLRIAYLSSRIFAGNAKTQLNPEPYAYEGAFSVRWLIQDQLKGKPELNADEKRGDVRAPVLAWGPYLWADGVKARADGVTFQPEDLGADGTHPSDSGRRKVAEMLLKFFKSDSNTQRWFLSASTGK